LLSIAFLRDHPEEARTRLATLGKPVPLGAVLALDTKRRSVLVELEGLRGQRNRANDTIKKAGRPTSEQRDELRALSDQIKQSEAALGPLEHELDDLLQRIPNLPHASVPLGKDERENVTLSHGGIKRQFAFTPKPHWEIGEHLGILDLDAGVRIAGTRFYVTRGLGARLQRALVSYFLDTHVERQGYTEVSTPYLVNSHVMRGAGKLPKFADDAYQLPDDDLWLNPTAEVPVTGLLQDQVLGVGALPVRYTAYCPSWRREAGAAGRDTRGTIRLHQFHKVEMYAFTKPEDSYTEFERMTQNAIQLLDELGFYYRRVRLCTGDLGFAATLTDDLEAWLPGLQEFKEVSSVSNCEAFQARRANIRFRPAEGERPEFVHTLNGSGLPVDRTFAAILENYQEADGSVTVPEVLRRYMGVDVIRRG
jgi:seryl-tRNA synthetase